MAKHPSLMMKAAVVATVAAALFLSVSAGKVDDHKFCSCGRAKDQRNFPVHVHKVLDDVVKRTADQPKNPDSGDTVFTTTSNPGASLQAGAAVATGTCFKGGPTDCSACLAQLGAVLKPCGTFGCGGAEFVGDCHLQFAHITL